MTVAEKLCELVQHLSEEQAAEVLNFAEFVRAKQNGGKKVSSVDKVEAWKRLIASVKAYEKDDFPTLEEIRANQGEDVPRESW